MMHANMMRHITYILPFVLCYTKLQALVQAQGSPSAMPSSFPNLSNGKTDTMMPSMSVIVVDDRSPSMLPSEGIPIDFADPCFDFQCSNDGTCKIFYDEPDYDGIDNMGGTPYCECAQGFFGKHCSQQTGCDLGCVNGECLVDSRKGTKYCNCLTGWGGDACEMPKVQCITDGGIFACYNGGACDAQSCDCSKASYNSSKWEGDECEIITAGSSIDISNATIVLIAAFVTIFLGLSCCCCTSIRQRCCYRSKSVPEDLRFSSQVASVEIEDKEII